MNDNGRHTRRRSQSGFRYARIALEVVARPRGVEWWCFMHCIVGHYGRISGCPCACSCFVNIVEARAGINRARSKLVVNRMRVCCCSSILYIFSKKK